MAEATPLTETISIKVRKRDYDHASTVKVSRGNIPLMDVFGLGVDALARMSDEDLTNLIRDRGQRFEQQASA